MSLSTRNVAPKSSLSLLSAMLFAFSALAVSAAGTYAYPSSSPVELEELWYVNASIPKYSEIGFSSTMVFVAEARGSVEDGHTIVSGFNVSTGKNRFNVTHYQQKGYILAGIHPRGGGGDEENSSPAAATPVVLAYFISISGNSDGYLTSFSAIDGATLWSAHTSVNSQAGLQIGDHMAYTIIFSPGSSTASGGNSIIGSPPLLVLQGYNLTNGDIEVHTEQPVGSSFGGVETSSMSSTLIVAQGGDDYVFDRKTGKFLCQHSARYGSIPVVGDTVAAGDRSGGDGATGQFFNGRSCQTVGSGFAPGIGPSGLAVAGENFYYLDAFSNFVQRYDADANFVWNVSTPSGKAGGPNGITTLPFQSDAVVIENNALNWLTCLNVTTGKILWEIEHSEFINSLHPLGEGILFVSLYYGGYSLVLPHQGGGTILETVTGHGGSIARSYMDSKSGRPFVVVGEIAGNGSLKAVALKKKLQ